MRNASLVSSYPAATFARADGGAHPQPRKKSCPACVRAAARCVANPAKLAEPLSLVGHSAGLNGDVT